MGSRVRVSYAPLNPLVLFRAGGFFYALNSFLLSFLLYVCSFIKDVFKTFTIVDRVDTVIYRLFFFSLCWNKRFALSIRNISSYHTTIWCHWKAYDLLMLRFPRATIFRRKAEWHSIISFFVKNRFRGQIFPFCTFSCSCFLEYLCWDIKER